VSALPSQSAAAAEPTTGPLSHPESAASASPAAASGSSSLTRQYVDSLFLGRSPSECRRLQALLYLGSDRWRGLHEDFRAKGQPFVKTAEVGEAQPSRSRTLSLGV